MIEFLNVRKRFAGKEVLRGASWTLVGGELGVILGANGAGKSTLVRILGSLVFPDSGTVRLAGHANPVARRQSVGFVGHAPPLTPSLTVAENLLVRLKLSGYAEDVTDLECFVAYDLDNLASQMVRELSRGQAQRVALAMAEIGDPAIFLFDEPFTGLDVQQSERLVGRLHAAKRQGRTVLLTTHDVELGLAHADRLALLTAGKLYEVPREVREAPDAGDRLRALLREPAPASG